jgi:hypothetical protein
MIMSLRVSFAVFAGTALVALWPGVSRAAGPTPVTEALLALQPLAALRWDAPSLLSVQSRLVSAPRTTRASFSFGYRRALPKAFDPSPSAWVSDRGGQTPSQPALSVPLTPIKLEGDDRSEVDNATRVGMSYLNPTLLRFADDETDVAVSISPGGLCTGACLKVTGSFQ